VLPSAGSSACSLNSPTEGSGVLLQPWGACTDRWPWVILRPLAGVTLGVGGWLVGGAEDAGGLEEPVGESLGSGSVGVSSEQAEAVSSSTAARTRDPRWRDTAYSSGTGAVTIAAPIPRGRRRLAGLAGG
jgi:hypothetical protein